MSMAAAAAAAGTHDVQQVQGCSDLSACAFQALHPAVEKAYVPVQQHCIGPSRQMYHLVVQVLSLLAVLLPLLTAVPVALEVQEHVVRCIGTTCCALASIWR